MRYEPTHILTEECKEFYSVQCSQVDGAKLPTFVS